MCLCFLGDEEPPNKLRKPLLFDEVWCTTGGGGGGATGLGGTRALNWAVMCGSRLIFSVRVNSSLLCSMLGRVSASCKMGT